MHSAPASAASLGLQHGWEELNCAAVLQAGTIGSTLHQDPEPWLQKATEGSQDGEEPGLGP